MNQKKESFTTAASLRDAARRNGLAATLVAAVATLLLAGALAGCSHKLVAPGGGVVRVYPSADALGKMHQMKREGGAMGMLGELSSGLIAKEVPANTPVRIISRSPDAAEIEVTGGPNKGLHGFVAPQDLD